MFNKKTARGVYTDPAASPYVLILFEKVFRFPSKSRMEVFQRLLENEFNRLLSLIYKIQTITGLGFKVKDLETLKKSAAIKLYNNRESWDILDG